MQAVIGRPDGILPWRGARTIGRALARHGLFGLTARVVRALTLGGPTRLLDLYRAQLALTQTAPASPTFQSAGVPPQTSMGRTAANAPDASPAGYALDRDHTLPIDRFHNFLDCWDKHPIILGLLSKGELTPGNTYTIVVMPHCETSMSKLGDTLVLARHLAQRAQIPVRVIIYDPTLSGQLLPHLDDYEPVLSIETARTVPELRSHLSRSAVSDLVQFLVCGDQITPVYAEILTRSGIPQLDLVLVDMYLVEQSHKVLPIFLPGLNPIHAANVDYFLSRSIMKIGLALELLTGETTLDVYSLTTAALGRCLAPGSGLHARHIAFPMLCINETRDAILRRRISCLQRTAPLKTRLDCSRAPSCISSRGKPSVSIVICTKDNGFLLEQLVERLWAADARHLVDVVVVSNQTTNPYAIDVFAKLKERGAIKLLTHDQPFNFSRQCNRGASVAGGDILLFLNDDIVPVNREWLTELIAPLDEPGIGVVGPLLLYPDQTVQHAGMFLGFNNVAGHALRAIRLPAEDYMFMASAPRQVMSVTGAALCMRRRDFDTLNGFDENLFALHIQDVDLCLRAHFSGLAVVYNPRSILLHMESVSVKPTLVDAAIGERRGREHAAFLKRWKHVLASDEFHNPNFSRDMEDLRNILRPIGSSSAA